MGKSENLFCERILKDNSRQKYSYYISNTEADTIAWGHDAVKSSYLYITNEI